MIEIIRSRANDSFICPDLCDLDDVQRATLERYMY